MTVAELTLVDDTSRYAAISVDGYWSSEHGWCDTPGDTTLLGAQLTLGMVVGQGVSILKISADEVRWLPSLESLDGIAFALAESLKGAPLSLLSSEARIVLMLNSFEHLFQKKEIAVCAMATLEALYAKGVQERKKLHDHITSRML